MQSLAIGAGAEIAWTDAGKVLHGYTATFKNEKGGVTFRTLPSGGHFSHSIDGKEAGVMGYNQDVFLPAGSTLKLAAHHLGIKVEVIKKDSSIIILAERTMDAASFGKGVETSRAAAVISSENKLADLEKGEADSLFKGSRFFTPQVPGETNSGTK